MRLINSSAFPSLWFVYRIIFEFLMIFYFKFPCFSSLALGLENVQTLWCIATFRLFAVILSFLLSSSHESNFSLSLVLENAVYCSISVLCIAPSRLFVVILSV